MLVIFLVGVMVGACIGGGAVGMAIMLLLRTGRKVTCDEVTALQRNDRPVYPMAADILDCEAR